MEDDIFSRAKRRVVLLRKTTNSAYVDVHGPDSSKISPKCRFWVYLFIENTCIYQKNYLVVHPMLFIKVITHGFK